jgi:hypothetical protein
MYFFYKSLWKGCHYHWTTRKGSLYTNIHEWIFALTLFVSKLFLSLPSPGVRFVCLFVFLFHFLFLYEKVCESIIDHDEGLCMNQNPPSKNCTRGYTNTAQPCLSILYKNLYFSLMSSRLVGGWLVITVETRRVK